MWEKIIEFVATEKRSSEDIKKELEELSRKNYRKMYSTLDLNGDRFGVKMEVDTEAVPSYILSLLPPLDGKRFVGISFAENFAAVEYSIVHGDELRHKLVVYKRVVR